MASIWRNLKQNKEIINMAARANPLIVFDVETTGLGKSSEIIELAAVKCTFQKGAFHMQSCIDIYIKPETEIKKNVSEINGITIDLLQNKPSAKDALPIIDDFLGGKPCLCAYNAKFDIQMLSKLYRSQGRELEYAIDIDMYQIVKDIFCCEKMQNLKLETIASTYGVDNNIEFHSAFDDVKVLVRIINAVIKDIKLNSSNENDINVNVNSLYYSEGYRGNARVYLNTSSGRLYYSFKDDKWMPFEEGMKLKKLNMGSIEEQMFNIAKCKTYKELREICKKNGAGLLQFN